MAPIATATLKAAVTAIRKASTTTIKVASITTKVATIYERCRVAPPPKCTAELSLPLVFFDIVFLQFIPTQRLLFYKYPCSNQHFLETIVPNIKHSLSQTLKHYLPLTGNLIYPLKSGFPEFRYVPGDSISLTIAKSNEASDFDYLTGDGPRDAVEFHSLVPDLPNPEIDHQSGVKIIPVFAVQVTHFPQTGICLGFINHHAIGDASSIAGFLKTWSSISMQIQGNVAANLKYPVPFFDRSVVKDPSGLANIFWSQRNLFTIDTFPLPLPLNKVRTTFTLLENDIQKLKNLVQDKNPGMIHLSSFTVTIAYVWTCLIKSGTEVGEQVDDNEPVYFVFAVDARRRLNPPLPTNYFGNCLAYCEIESTHGELKGENGFLKAVELISAIISKKVNNKDEMLGDAKNWMKNVAELLGKRPMAVVGSPRFDLYGTEFRWGKPEKYEVVSIDGPGAMSLCKSREFEGGLEFGLSLPSNKMDAFDAIFKAGLKM